VVTVALAGAQARLVPVLVAGFLLASLTGCSGEDTQVQDRYAVQGKMSEANGDLVEARQSYERSLEVDPGQPTVLHDLAVLNQAEGELDEATRLLREALAIDPGLHGSRLLLADILLEAGRGREALVEYEVLVDAAPAGVDLDVVRERIELIK